MTRNIVSLLIVIILGILVFITITEMPEFQSVHKPTNNILKQRYTQEVLDDTGIPNMVTAILLDYRGFDTMGEATVLFAASIAVASILKKI